MKFETVDPTKVVDALEGLSRKLELFGERVAPLEAAAAIAVPLPQRSRKSPRQRPPGSPHRTPRSTRGRGGAQRRAGSGEAQPSRPSSEKAHIRQIHLIVRLRGPSQGRVMIQASHAFRFIRRGSSIETEDDS